METRPCTGRYVGRGGFFEKLFPRFVRLPCVLFVCYNLASPVCSRPLFGRTADRQWSELRNANAEVASVVKRLHDLHGAHPEVYADGVRTAVASFAKRVRFFRFFSHARSANPGASGCPTAPRS